MALQGNLILSLVVLANLLTWCGLSVAQTPAPAPAPVPPPPPTTVPPPAMAPPPVSPLPPAPAPVPPLPPAPVLPPSPATVPAPPPPPAQVLPPAPAPAPPSATIPPPAKVPPPPPPSATIPPRASAPALPPSVPSVPANKTSSFNRSSFPPDIIFGAASAAFQYEGAVNEGGRGPSIWDYFTHQYPEKISDRSNADVANDFYHRYKQDIKLMKFIGLDGFRFSFSWTRILPKGKLSGGINQEGIAFYNNLINELIINGITPFATIFHWDLPLTLQNEYGGFLSPKIVDDYRDFAELCFKEFGDRVKYWSTINEPWTFASGAYDSGTFAPGRCSDWMNLNCTGGDSGIEPYLVAHHIILSHGAAVKVYREKYKATQKGQIGIVLVTNYMYPYDSKSSADVKATQRGIDFMYGWFLDPITWGDYPRSMRDLVGTRLPRFTAEESALLNSSYDFLGLNYYTSNYAKFLTPTNGVNLSYTTDSQASLIFQASNGSYIGAPTGASTFYVHPLGLHDLLVYTKKKYRNPPIYITENGLADANVGTASQLINDTKRVGFYNDHLMAVKRAVDEGVNLKGYFAWSFLDTWEWSSGYTMRFGINFVDYDNGLIRIPKLSGLWIKKFLTG